MPQPLSRASWGAMILSRKCIETVRRFDAFRSGGDPWQKHDFGAFEDGRRCLFYTVDMRYDLPEPSDQSVTVCVMTIMLADKY
jgi:hypothetical protein